MNQRTRVTGLMIRRTIALATVFALGLLATSLPGAATPGGLDTFSVHFQDDDNGTCTDGTPTSTGGMWIPAKNGERAEKADHNGNGLVCVILR